MRILTCITPLATASAACLFATSTLLAADAPKLLPFQGRLTDAVGTAIPDGPRVVQFKIYDAPVGGQALWNGEVQKLTVNAGLVNTTLGTKASLASVDFNRSLYLEITIDANSDSQITAADPPLLPRQSILPAVFAKEAADSRLLGGCNWSALFGTNDPAQGTLLDSKIRDHSIGVSKLDPGFGVPIPVGGVIMWWGAAADVPAGYEICDGGVPTTSGALLPGNKPDLRDRFVKGATAGTADVKATPVTGGEHTIAEQNTGGTALSQAQIPAHQHTGTTGTGNVKQYGTFQGTPSGAASYSGTQASVPIGAGWCRDDDQWSNSDHTHNFATSSVGSDQAHNHTISAHDNRPAFLEMFFIIRVK